MTRPKLITVLAIALGSLIEAAGGPPRVQVPIIWDPICGADYSPEKHARRLRELEFLKAALLYRCLEFVQWPAANGPGQELTLGLLGTSGFTEAANSLAGRTVGDRTLRVKTLADLEDAPSCQIVFISSSEKRRIPQILEHLAPRPILTVSETPKFAQRGGMLNLQNNGPKVEMEVNPSAAQSARVRIHPKLLKLATAVVSMD